MSSPAARAAETYFVRTDDGWSLALHRYKPATQDSGKSPVILCHDMTLNSAFWDLDKEKSLAAYLSAQGFDVWAVDLRGAGSSTKPGWLSRAEIMEGKGDPRSRFGKEDWTVDDIIHLDIPAVLRLVKEKTGHDQVSWVGHGMGASAMAGFLVTHDGNAVKHLVAVGMPMAFPKPLNDILIDLAKRKETGQLAARFNGLGLEPSGEVTFGELFYHLPNMESRTLGTIRRRASEDVSNGVLDQFLVMLRSGEFQSSDKGTSYARNLEKITVPFFCIAGPLDNLAGIAGMYDAFGHISSPDKALRVFDRANGYSTDYGHNDLIAGEAAPAEVYPAIARWLKERS